MSISPVTSVTVTAACTTMYETLGNFEKTFSWGGARKQTSRSPEARYTSSNAFLPRVSAGTQYVVKTS